MLIIPVNPTLSPRPPPCVSCSASVHARWRYRVAGKHNTCLRSVANHLPSPVPETGNGFLDAFVLAYKYNLDLVLSPSDVFAQVGMLLQHTLENDNSGYDEAPVSSLQPDNQFTLHGVPVTRGDDTVRTFDIQVARGCRAVFGRGKGLHISSYHSACGALHVQPGTTPGIRNIRLRGTQKQWVTVMTRLQKAIHTHCSYAPWGYQVRMLLHRFVRAFVQGSGDRDFWADAISIDARTGLIRGWALLFFGHMQDGVAPCDLSSFTRHHRVVMRLDMNDRGKEEHADNGKGEVELECPGSYCSGFTGVHCEDRTSVRPCQTTAFFAHSSTPLPKV